MGPERTCMQNISGSEPPEGLNNVCWDIVVDICVDFPGLCIINFVLFVVKISNKL